MYSFECLSFRNIFLFIRLSYQLKMDYAPVVSSNHPTSKYLTNCMKSFIPKPNIFREIQTIAKLNMEFHSIVDQNKKQIMGENKQNLETQVLLDRTPVQSAVNYFKEHLLSRRYLLWGSFVSDRSTSISTRFFGQLSIRE